MGGQPLPGPAEEGSAAPLPHATGAGGIPPQPPGGDQTPPAGGQTPLTAPQQQPAASEPEPRPAGVEQPVEADTPPSPDAHDAAADSSPSLEATPEEPANGEAHAEDAEASEHGEEASLDEPAPPENGASVGSGGSGGAPRAWPAWLSGARGTWAAIALLCVVAGVAGSLLGARAVAHDEAAQERTDFKLSATETGARLKLAVQQQEDMQLSAATFFAGKPRASHAEFNSWASWMHAPGRYPALARMALVAEIPAAELAAFEAALGYTPPTAPTTLRGLTRGSALAGTSTSRIGLLGSSAARAANPLHIVPPGERPYYCLTVASLARSPLKRPPAGLDMCPGDTALRAARDAGRSHFAAATVGGLPGLAVDVPVYRGGTPPSSRGARRATFVGWLRELLTPSALVAHAVQGHTAVVLSLSHEGSAGSVSFASGTPRSGAQSVSIPLQRGWSATASAAPVATGIFSYADAELLLLGGCLLSLLVGAALLLLGGRGARPPGRRRLPTVPNEDLYDQLTGLPNRALTLDRAERMLARVGRQPGMLAGALFVDIDWLKDVNEKLGPAAGDQLLTIVAERLENVARAHDTVGRLGGDEFVVLVEAAARGVRLDRMARRVIEALHKPVELEGFGPSFFLTVSIGVAFGRYEDVDELLRDAHLALDAAKAAGKDRYTIFNANMRSVIEERGLLEVDLNRAVQDKQFHLLYQPIYDLRTERVVGLEALIRWLHPTRGVLPPAEFLPLAEETGLIVPIGRRVLEEACLHAAAWNVAGVGGQRIGISVNVSAKQLNRDGFVTDVRRALQESGLDPVLLTLEIAEETVLLDVAAAAARIDELKQLGVRVAIDDFGSGYAYRSDLQRMNLDFLKVDRSSIASSDDEDYRNWLLEAIVVLGRDMSLTVIGKGVETPDQLRTLKVMGCTMAQGFYLAKPVTAESVEAVIEAGPAHEQSLAQPS
jgi:diguanylate cyclase (GGDEF)-like protein